MFAGSTSPSPDVIEITPDDDTDLTKECRSLYIGGAGTLRVTTLNGNVRNFIGLPAGFILPVVVKRVHEAGTSATGIVGLV